METKGWVEKLVFLFVGGILVISFLFLTGASGVPQVGRYQLEAVSRNEYADILVIDTSTGAVKWIDFKDQNLPFEQIKVKKGLFD